ncbi:hypothetical protein ACSBLW_08695 [Thioclava sp. FR2]|uniref:hypothetical protein n=1 Tax=Thioclava sp. FR2 TaxID=3445780 RepID=UPI003EB9EB3A
MANRIAKLMASVPLVLALAGCVQDGLSPYTGDPNTVIATGVDRGRDSGVLRNGQAAIAYDPDGCQNWIMDDGVEGYSTPRYDPVSGLPVCNGHYPPGTIIRNYQTGTQGIRDYVPGPGIRTVVRRAGN